MDRAPKTKTDLLSVKLFFVVLGAIAAYNVIDWMRGEPEWEERIYEPGAFAVQTAGRPNLRKLREPLSFGEVGFQYLMFERAEVQYAIAYGDVPESVHADSAIAARRDVILQKVEGTILSEAAVEVDGYPAWQTQIQAADESRLRLQSLQVGQRLYSLMAVGAPYAFDDTSNIERFFSSFRLAKPR